jgi:signal transduction histidine kinase
MVDRTLEARLTSRLLIVIGAALVAVATAAVVVIDRVLDASDTASARALVLGARDTLRRELDEGDKAPEALDEILSATASGRGIRVTVRPSDGSPRSAGALLPGLAPDACTTLLDEAGLAWRACEASQGSTSLVAAISIAQHREAVSALGRGMFGVVLLALLALWFAVRGAVRAPVAELASLVGWTTRIVAAERATPSPSSGTKEIAQLGRAFEDLIGRLFEALARERASSAHIAHELRTPLTAICAELDALPLANPSTSDAVRRIRADVAKLADSIEAILVLSSSSAARSETIVNVADLARELLPEGASLQAPDEALVEADEPLIALALRNLIDNAQRHGRGVRGIAVSRAGDALRVAVVDEGPGVDEAARARMFERYWRGSADGDGQGLGLALVKAVAERHGGTARADAGPSGRGLCVSMTLGRLVGWHGSETAPG